MSDSTSQRFTPSPQQRRAVQVAGAGRFVSAAYRVEGTLSRDELEAALRKLAGEVEILRTSVVPHGVTCAQVVEAQARLSVDDESADHANAHEALIAFASNPALADVHVACRLTRAGGQRQLLLLQPRANADASALDILAGLLLTTLAGDEPALPVDEEGASLQYADLAALQEDLLTDEDGAEGRAHLATLSLAPAADQRLGLERPLGGDAAPIEIVRALTEDEARALHAVSARAECSRAAVALAAWTTVVSRQADVAEPVLALASEGRDYEGLDVALGLFEKHVPFVLGPRPEESFDALATRAQATLEQALEDHDAWDAAASEAPAQLPHAFAWRGAFDTAAGDRRLWVSARSGQNDRSRATVAFESFAIDAGTDVLTLRVVADASALDRAAATALADQVVTLVVDAHARPRSSALEQSAASASWCERLTSELARTPAAKRLEETITRLLAASAERSPNGIAVRGKSGERSYAELEARTNRIARHLRSLGVGPGSFVGLYFERGPQMIEALVGVLKAGGAYLPLPPSYPDERVLFMLEDTGAPVLLTSTKRSGGMPSSAAKVIVLDQLEAELALLEDGPLDELHGPDDPAYVIYTSGSTGKPKGVPITHANLFHSTIARREHYREAVSAYLLLSSFAFDSSVPGIFWTLTSGGTLVLPPEGAERELGQLPSLIKAHAVSHLLALPSVYGLLLETSKPGELDGLRAVIVAGESATPELVVRHEAKLPDCALYDEYGPTENTVWSTVQRCSARDAYFTVPIGRPVPGVRAFVAEPVVVPPVPVAAGMTGELLVGGPQLTPGYLGRSELTAEQFVLDRDGARLYRTGDLARMHPDGTIEFLGRLDHQVKLRGYRIELEEIEAVMVEREDVREAVVTAPDFGSEGGPEDRRLVGYVLGSGDAVDVDALRSHLARRLPEYMVPAHVLALDELPRLPNGKVDRSALPLPGLDVERADAAVGSEGTALERLIAHFWAELLETDTVGLDEDFFDLGGHSLLAARFFAQLNETLQIEAPLRFLFDNPSVRGLAAAIEASADEGPRAARAAELALQVLGLDEAVGATGAADASETALERLIGTLWADGLGLERVGPEEDFFDLGGHSLLAARLFAQTNELLQTEAALRLLFDNPTVRGLCSALAGNDPAEAARLERTAELTLEVLESD